MKLPSLAFRVDESGKIPDGARVMNDDEVYAYQMRKVAKYEPQSDMHWITKANNLVFCGSVISTLGLVTIFRNIIKIPSTKGSIFTLIPAVTGSVVMATILHGSPRHRIILGNSSQSIRWNSGIVNGIACGPVSSLLSLAYCFGLKRKIDGSTYVQIFKSINSRHLLYASLGVTFIQCCVGYYIADREINCLEKATLYYQKFLANSEENESTYSK